LRASVGSKELLRDVLETFIDNAPERLAQLDDSVAAGNLRNAGDVAHAIKGTAATVGAARLSAAAAKIVNGVRYEHPEEVIAGHEELRREFDILTAEVARINWEIV
jgi:HPt (histidine-containing phosphotransfer) domain-containing protein